MIAVKKFLLRKELWSAGVVINLIKLNGLQVKRRFKSTISNARGDAYLIWHIIKEVLNGKNERP